MAHVLVASRNPISRTMLHDALAATGHTVTTVGDGVLAVAALWVARRPVVAVLDDGLDPLDAADILSLAADASDADSHLRLARHRYVVTSSLAPERTPADVHLSLTILHATLLPLPADLAHLCTAVGQAARDLPRTVPASGIAETLLPWPARLAHVTHVAQVAQGV